MAEQSQQGGNPSKLAAHLRKNPPQMKVSHPLTFEEARKKLGRPPQMHVHHPLTFEEARKKLGRPPQSK